MKKLRKLVSLLLAVVMLTSLSVCGGVAASTTGSITISNATAGETYAIYKLLDLSYDASTGSYAYTIDSSSDWYEFFTDSTDWAGDYVSIDDNGYVTWAYSTSDTATMQAFGELVAKYIDEKGIDPTVNEVTATDTTVKFADLDLGYYYVTSTLGSLVSITSTDLDAEIEDKNDKPTIKKYVATSNTTDTDWEDDYIKADFSNIIYFKVVITGVDEITELTLHDALPDGYTLDSVVSVNLVSYLSNVKTTTALTKDTDYTLTNPTDTCTDTTGEVSGCDFEICFDKLLADTTSGSTYDTYVLSSDNPASAYIEIIYTVTVDEDEVAINSVTSSAAENLNTAYITSSTDNTKKDTAGVYYFEIYVYKFTTPTANNTNSSTGVALEGAEFILSYKDSTSTTYYAVVDGDDGEYTLTSWTTDKDEASTLTTNSSGIIHVEGLNDGTYTLTETKAPEGYALPSNVDTTITITTTEATGGATIESVAVTTTSEVTYGTDSVYATKIENSTTSAMPSTGGIGVTIFYVFGGIIVVAAVALIVVYSRKRAKAER